MSPPLFFLPIQRQLKETRRNDVPFDKDLAEHFINQGIEISFHGARAAS
jgi:hypothetical protein